MHEMVLDQIKHVWQVFLFCFVFFLTASKALLEKKSASIDNYSFVNVGN